MSKKIVITLHGSSHFKERSSTFRSSSLKLTSGTGLKEIKKFMGKAPTCEKRKKLEMNECEMIKHCFTPFAYAKF